MNFRVFINRYTVPFDMYFFFTTEELVVNFFHMLVMSREQICAEL
jgi:hypothetical protein